jgi:hypothetical protein
MARSLLPVFCSSLGAAALQAALLLDLMDEIHFHTRMRRGHAELVKGHAGKAVRFTFDWLEETDFFVVEG